MRVLVVGLGAAGARVARQVLSDDSLTSLTVVDTDPDRAAAVARSLGSPATVGSWDDGSVQAADVVVLAVPGEHAPMAETALDAGAHVVSLGAEPNDARALLALDERARHRDRCMVVGAGFAPGFSCLLARHAAAAFDTVDEVHVASAGTGGPACARRHHGSLTGEAVEWHDGSWVTRRGGTGRQLCWFPEPIGARDCYLASVADPLVLVPAFPGVARVTARVEASRRDMVSSRLPMLRRPHPEGTLGALRVEVRGRRGVTTGATVLGALDRPAVAAATVAGVAALWAKGGLMARSGAGGLAELVPDPVPFLQELARRGVRAAAFDVGAA